MREKTHLLRFSKSGLILIALVMVSAVRGENESYWVVDQRTPERTRDIIFGIGSDGRLGERRWVLDRDPSSMESLEGSTTPLISPDQAYVAYTHGYNLYLLNLRTGSTERVTSSGKPPTDRFAEVLHLISCWSGNSERVYFRVAPGDTGFCEGPEPEVRKADYGLYAYDLKTRKKGRVAVEGNFVMGLPSEKLLIQAPPYESLFILTQGKQEPLFTSSSHNQVGQVWVPSEGDKLLCRLGEDGRSQIAELNIRTHELKIVSPRGSFAEYQWPRWSPDRRHVSWLRGKTEGRKNVFTMEIDGKPISKSRGCFDYVWIGNEMVAVRFDDGIKVLGLDGVERAAYLLEHLSKGGVVLSINK